MVHSEIHDVSCRWPWSHAGAVGMPDALSRKGRGSAVRGTRLMGT